MAFFRVKAKGSLTDYLLGLGHSRTKIKQLLKYGAIEVNGKVISSPDHFLTEGDKISVRKNKKEPNAVPSLGIKVVYEDETVIVTEKPAGLLTIASETEKTRTAYYRLNEFLWQRAPGARERIFIVHRLDRDTSGLILFAKSERVKRILQDSWRTAEKRYYAIVEGTPEKHEGEIQSYLRETKSLKVYSGRHSDEGKLAKTKYRVLKRCGEYSLLDILLETGRKNQIRVHLSDLGHPVAGDKKYGARTDPFRRLGLHAYLLSFNHPITGQPLRFESKMPGRFHKLMMR